jgi:hypothetical protein
MSVQGKYVTSRLMHSWKLLWLCVDLLSFKAVAWKPNLCSDPHGRIIGRDIRNPVSHDPQRETVALRLDRVHPMHPWGLHPGSERTRRTERYEYRGFQEVVSRAWLLVLGIDRDCVLRCFGCLGGPEVWTQDHVAVYRGLQSGWRSQCQLYPRSRCLYPYHYQR